MLSLVEKEEEDDDDDLLSFLMLDRDVCKNCLVVSSQDVLLSLDDKENQHRLVAL